MRFSILVLLLAVVGCDRAATVNLGGGYFLAAHDSDHRYIYKAEDDENRIVIDQQIVGYRVVDSYILVHRMVSNSYDCVDEHGQTTIFTRYSDEYEFWIIDSRAGKVSGPISRNSFKEFLLKNDLSGDALKDDVKYQPNIDAFEKQTAKCKTLKPV